MRVLEGLVVDYGGVLTDFGDLPSGIGALTEAPLLEVLRRVRKHGMRTALLSNADGIGSLPLRWVELFNAVVFSGVIGFGKPDPRIYRLTADRIGLLPTECVFVDDLALNVSAAVSVGMVGVHHRSIEATVTELEVLLQLPLR